jgi:hypothetical protein
VNKMKVIFAVHALILVQLAREPLFADWYDFERE